VAFPHLPGVDSVAPAGSAGACPGLQVC
jgi:hypothetical protein